MNTAKKLSAAQIGAARNLPPRLIAIGREIEARAAKADTYHGKATDMVDSIKALLIEAQSFCDKGGLNAFRKRYCPSLGRSRAYELLSIASGRKSARQIKASTTARQRRYLAKLKAAGAAMHRAVITDSASPSMPLRPLRPTRDGSDTVQGFTARVLELVLMTATAKPADFSGAPIEADDLRTLADFLMSIAARKPNARKLRLVK